MSPQNSEIHKSFGHLKTKLFAINTSLKNVGLGCPWPLPRQWENWCHENSLVKLQAIPIQEIRSKNQLERRKMTYVRFDSS